MSESEFLTYEGKFGDTLSSKLDAKAGNLSVNLEGRGTTKLQSSFGKLRKQEVDVMKLLQDSNERWMSNLSLYRLHLQALLAHSLSLTFTIQESEEEPNHIFSMPFAPPPPPFPQDVGHAACAGAADGEESRGVCSAEGEDPHHHGLQYHRDPPGAELLCWHPGSAGQPCGGVCF